MKRELCWIGLLTAFGATLLAAKYFGWLTTGGFGSLVTAIFFGYCAIILVAQVFSALMALRALVRDAALRNGELQRATCRSGQDNRSREEQS
jgi:hypothetical protein